MQALGATTIKRLISAQFPEVSPARVELLGEGCDFWAYQIDDRWVFRFPKSDYGAARLRPEIALLTALARSLPLPVPDYRFIGQGGDGFAHGFAGYAKLPGVSAMRVRLPEDALDRAARALGGFLARLHRHDVNEAAAAGIPGTEAGASLARMRERALAHLTAVGPLLTPELRQQIGRFFNDRAHLPPEFDGAARLIHADLTAEHVLIDPASAAISGIIDWTDMRTGDVAVDFAGLWHWQGDRGVTVALRNYGGATDPRIWDRIRFIGLWKALEDIRYGSESGDRAYSEFGIRCVRRTFAERSY